MSVAIVVTFDLHGVRRSERWRTYSRIKRTLAVLQINKFVVTKDGRESKLPANTFVGIFRGPLSENASPYIRDITRRKVVSVVRRYHKNATVFVFIGKKWAWGKRRI